MDTQINHTQISHKSISRRSFLGLAIAVPGVAALAATNPQLAVASQGSLSANGVAASKKLLSAQETQGIQEPQLPGTSETEEIVYAGVSITARGQLKGSNWTSWCKSGATLGKTDGKGLVSISLKLKGLRGLAGSVQYRVYKRKSGWLAWTTDGAATTVATNVEAIKVKLTGDVAAHYDVLYRVYMKNRGWTKWVKNGSNAGAIGKSSRVNALQVKLSAKTQEALGKSTATVGVCCAAYVRKTGWDSWVAAGATCGTTGLSRALGGIALQVDKGSRSGSVKYCAHLSGIGWKDWQTNGEFAGSTSHNLEAMRIKLTGNLAKIYDIYYRAYVSNYGWLDWARNGQEAGSTGFAMSMDAYEVKLVKKDKAAPGKTKYRTVNALEAASKLDGIDISSWQKGIQVSKVSGDFVIVKATQGNWYTNPYFTQQVRDTLKCEKLLGIYHYADLRGSAKQQADYFVKKVKPYLGECILVLDWEERGLLPKGPAWAKKFLDQVYEKTGVRPLIYMSQSVTRSYNWSKVAPNYRLWVAQYLYSNFYIKNYRKNPTHWALGYWNSATIYQYSSTATLKGYGSHLDVNKFYGSALMWKKLCGKS